MWGESSGALARRLALLVVGLLLGLPGVAAATTYTVTTTGDGASTCPSAGSCSLRGAINTSTSGDAVVVPASAGAYALSTGSAIAINHDLTIVGAGASSTTVNANQTSGVFTVGAGHNVAISGLTITGGKLTGGSVKGAGINTSGNLTLNGVTVTNNSVESASGGTPAGGGIEVTAGNLSVSNSQITGNVARADAGGGFPEGAGIDDSGGGLVNVSGSQVTSNVASTGAGGGVPAGGGIHFGGSGTLAISASSLSQNSALTGGGGGAAEGGGLASDGGGVVTLTGSTVSANSASMADAGAADGGGIANFAGSLAIANSTISANIALSPAAGGVPTAQGAGVLSSGPLAITSSTVTGNTANASSAGTAQGGAVDVSGSATISNSTITGNSASTTGTGTSDGGGVSASTSQPVTLTSSTIDANSAAGGSGGSNGANLFAGVATLPSVENSIVSSGNGAGGTNCSGNVTSQGHNVDSGKSCGFTAAGDQQGTDAQLGPLQDNGGPTQTQAVHVGSPVIDAANTADCPATDQRGVARPQGPACDIGALEAELPQVAANPASGISQTAATLNGSVSPNTLKAGDASYNFEYGPTMGYGSVTPTATNGSGAVSAAVSGLSPNTTYHYRLVATNSDGGSASSADMTFTTRPAPAPPPHVKPKITGLGETHRLFVVGRNVTPLNAAADNRTLLNGGNSPGTQPTPGRHAKGTVFSFTLNQAATVKIKLSAQKPGRLQGRKCRPPSPKLQNRPRCTRSVRVVTLTRTGIVGLNLVAFSGRLPHRILPPGRYQAVYTATNENGISGPQTIGFTIVRK